MQDVRSPEQLRGLSYPEVADLAAQIRDELVTTVSRRGGHLASNLGVVELTLAVHRVFDTPRDQIVFDVGHQSYVHKLITGRCRQFNTLRTFGGLSGFPKRCESEYDVFETGHASTAVSAALGLARARDLRGGTQQVVAIVGDGALTGGMSYEALNDAGSSNTHLIVILNDNGMSIAPNVGALSRHLTAIRASSGYTRTRNAVRKGVRRLPLIGKPLYRLVHGVKTMVKSLFVDEGFFGTLGFHYYGPVDGHNQKELERTLRLARDVEGPVLIHVMTVKGYGYDKAEEKPEVFHGTPPFCVDTGDMRRKRSSLPPWGTVMAKELADMAREDGRIVALTAAMSSGTGLHHFRDEFPGRTFDVGIAEEHAVTMAAGLAAGGMRPYFAVYATFFQRCYDQLIHDVCMQRLPVVFLLDHAGIVGEDGATHQGVFDLAEILPIPDLIVLAPRDIGQLRAMLRWTPRAERPVVIRYGRKSVDLSEQYPAGEFIPAHWDVLEDGADAALLAVGSMVGTALETRQRLLAHGVNAAVVDCSSVKPMDEELLRRLAVSRPVITMEEHVLNGGFGSAVDSWCIREELPPPVLSFGVHDSFVRHGDRDKLLRYLGLTAPQMAERIRILLKERAERIQTTEGITHEQ